MNSCSIFPSSTGNDFVDVNLRHEVNGGANYKNNGSGHGAGMYSNDSLQDLDDHVGAFVGSGSDSDGEPQPKYGKKTRGRVKIKMQFINNKLRRYTTFSKRKTGIMKKVITFTWQLRLCHQPVLCFISLFAVFALFSSQS